MSKAYTITHRKDRHKNEPVCLSLSVCVSLLHLYFLGSTTTHTHRNVLCNDKQQTAAFFFPFHLFSPEKIVFIQYPRILRAFHHPNPTSSPFIILNTNQCSLLLPFQQIQCSEKNPLQLWPDLRSV